MDRPTQTYPQRLHDLFNEVLADPDVKPHEVIMEAMDRAYRLGAAE